MNYRYKCGDEVLKVWVFDDGFKSDVIVLGSSSGKFNKTSNLVIDEDEKGRYFKWGKTKVYLNDWLRTSMKEIKERLDSNKMITSDDLCQAILSDGAENVRLLVPMRTVRGFFSRKGKTKNILCKIKEDCLREIYKNHKIVVVPVKPDDRVESSREFCASDMLLLIYSGQVKIVV